MDKDYILNLVKEIKELRKEIISLKSFIVDTANSVQVKNPDGGEHNIRDVVEYLLYQDQGETL